MQHSLFPSYHMPPAKPKSIYIAGPMSGYSRFNFPAFYAAEEKLKQEGWDLIFNPAKADAELPKHDAFRTGDHVKAVQDGFNFREVFTWDMAKVIEADAIYMLRGWSCSAGAVAEHTVAKVMQRHYPNYRIFYEH